MTNEHRPGRIIVADENIPLVEAYFGGLGEIRRFPGRTLRAEQVKEADILLVRSVTKVNQQLLGGSRVSFVGTCTIGMDHLDTAYLRNAGITYSNAPGCNANSVVDYVFAALAALQSPWWQKSWGIIGCGNVGSRLLSRINAMGLAAKVYDPFLCTDQIPQLDSLEAVLACDIVCVHAPLTDSGPFPTQHLLDFEQFQQLKSGAIVISAGRGAVVNNQQLLRYLRDTLPDLQVVMDVWEPEPEIPVELVARVALATPHIAGYSYDGKLAGTAMIYDAVCRHLAVNPAMLERDEDVSCLPVSASTHQTAQAFLFAVIKSAYDIGVDDRNLRDLAASGESLQRGFDQLRKDYPKRREYLGWKVTVPTHLAGARLGTVSLLEMLRMLRFDVITSPSLT